MNNIDNINQRIVVIFSFTHSGKELAEKIILELNNNYNFKYTLHINSKNKNYNLHNSIKKYFEKDNIIVFISATGIAVRLIHSYVKDKKTDPAVIVINDTGKFVIPLISGHLGGANKFSKFLAKLLNAIPVITTATDNRNIESPDLFAKKNNYNIDSMSDAKKITSLMIEGKNILFFNENSNIIDYKNIIICKDIINFNKKIKSENYSGIIFISSKIYNINSNKPILKLTPKNIYLGIGLRKGVKKEIVKIAVSKALDKINFSTKAIKNIASIDIKKNERGLLEFAKENQIPIKFFTVKEIKSIENNFTKSDFVFKTVGVYNVSAPVAYLLAKEYGTPKIVLDKFIFKGVTISVSKIANGV